MSGKGVECNICGWTGASFFPLQSPGYAEHDPNVYCPCCGSYERHRAAAEYLRQTELVSGPGRALEIGSGLVRAYRRLAAQLGYDYVSLDLWPELGLIQGDATALPFDDGKFGLVFCSHALEHVSDDFTALAEMRRVTSDDGCGIVQVPFDDQRFDTVLSGDGPSDLLGSGYFYGHAREYGLDVIERLRYFWPHVVEVQPLHAIDRQVALRYGFEKNFGTFFVCSARPIGELRGELVRDLWPLKRHWLMQRRAHQIYQGEGKGALDDWLRAERELTAAEKRLCGVNVFDILGPRKALNASQGR